MDDNMRFKMLKKYLGLTNKDIARITGLSETAVQRGSSRGGFSRHFKFALWVFEKMYKERLEMENQHIEKIKKAIGWSFKP